MRQPSDSHPGMSCWFAVRTKSRQEKISAAMLESLAVDHYLPLQTELRQWSDRKQAVAVPLFSGYLFVRMTLDGTERGSILRVPGIVGFVGNKDGPSPIPDHEVEDVRSALSRGAKCSVVPPIHVGERVRVLRGALQGLEGVLIRSSSSCRLVISIELIRQAVAVTVSQDDVVSVRAGSPYTVTRPLPPGSPGCRDLLAS